MSRASDSRDPRGPGFLILQDHGYEGSDTPDHARGSIVGIRVVGRRDGEGQYGDWIEDEWARGPIGGGHFWERRDTNAGAYRFAWSGVMASNAADPTTGVFQKPWERELEGYRKKAEEDKEQESSNGNAANPVQPKMKTAKELDKELKKKLEPRVQKQVAIQGGVNWARINRNVIQMGLNAAPWWVNFVVPAGNKMVGMFNPNAVFGLNRGSLYQMFVDPRRSYRTLEEANAAYAAKQKREKANDPGDVAADVYFLESDITLDETFYPA